MPQWRRLRRTVTALMIAFLYTYAGVTSFQAESDAAPADRIQFETLLSDISAQLIAASPEHVQEAIELALDVVRRFFGADRCGLLSVSDSLDAINVTFASYGEGVAHVSSNVNLARLCPWVAQRTVFDRQVVVPSPRCFRPASGGRCRSVYLRSNGYEDVACYAD